LHGVAVPSLLCLSVAHTARLPSEVKPAGCTPVNSAPFVSSKTLLQKEHALLLAIVHNAATDVAEVKLFDPSGCGGAPC
jgi:hypothetical protein